MKRVILGILMVATCVNTASAELDLDAVCGAMQGKGSLPISVAPLAKKGMIAAYCEGYAEQMQSQNGPITAQTASVQLGIGIQRNYSYQTFCTSYFELTGSKESMPSNYDAAQFYITVGSSINEVYGQSHSVKEKMGAIFDMMGKGIQNPKKFAPSPMGLWNYAGLITKAGGKNTLVQKLVASLLTNDINGARAVLNATAGIQDGINEFCGTDNTTLKSVKAVSL